MVESATWPYGRRYDRFRNGLLGNRLVSADAENQKISPRLGCIAVMPPNLGPLRTFALRF
jgi:hypothetical protein